MRSNSYVRTKPQAYRICTVLVALACAFGSALSERPALAATTIVVSSDAPNGWAFDGDGTTGGTGSFVAGPATPPLGTGSARLLLTTASSSEILVLPVNTGLSLSTITNLGYSTYRSSVDAGNNLALALQLNVDYDPADALTGWQGRLNYEPYQTTGVGGTVVQNTWQTWNPLSGKWWASGAPGKSVCPQAAPCTWAQVLAAFPNIRIHPTFGAILFKAGGNWAGFDGSVDAFTLGVSGVDTTYDFEPVTPCTTTCYVNSSTGSDTFSGESAASAKQTIQAGINQVSAGGTVIVASGTYTEAIAINKSDLTISGAGASVTTIVGPKTGGSDTVAFSSTGGTLQGFTITRDGNNPADWNANTRSQGVNMSGSGNTLRNSILTGNRNGILLVGSSNSIIGNMIDSNRTGIHIISSAKNNSIQGNKISNNFTVGLLFRQDDSTADATIVRGNQISGNWYSQTDDRGNPAGVVRDLRANWFGAPPLTLAIGNTSGEPGYAAQIPVAFGGTATPPPSAPTFVVNNQDPNSSGDTGGRGNLNTNRLAYSPWLSTGTNAAAAAAPGFVGDFSSLTADDAGATVGGTGYIQAGLTFVTTGGTVLVATGTFTDNLTITRTVTLAGAGQGNSLLRPASSNPNCGGAGGGSLCAGGSNIILVQASGVTIHDLTLDGDNPALTSGIVRDGADVDARNGIITNHTAGTFNDLDVHNVTLRNIYLRGMYASSGGTFNFHDTTVQNIQGDSASIGIFNFGGAGSMISNTVAFANDAIAANHSRGTQFRNNTVTNSASGVHSDNAGDGGGSADMIANNTVRDCMANGYGIFVFAPYFAPTVQQNKVQNCDIGLASFGQGAAVTTSFSANEVDGAHRPGSIGVFATTDMLGFGSNNNSSTFTNNRVENAAYGFLLESQPSYTLAITATENAISGNTTAGMGLQNTGTFKLDATHNWWGSPTGPSGTANPGGAGDSITATIGFDPWLCDGTDTSPAIGFQPNPAMLCGGADPDTSITSQPPSLTTSPTATFAFTGTDDVTPLAGLTFACNLDGTGFSACTSPITYTDLARGAHSFQVRATDLASHTDTTLASYTWSIQTDTPSSDAPPDTTITSQPLSLSTSPTATFTFTGSDDLTPAASLTFACSLDGAAFSACTSAIRYTDLANGAHTFEVRATDLTGHTDTTPASSTWNVNSSATPAQRKIYLPLIRV